MEYIDGIEFLSLAERCDDCNGTGDWYEEESGLDWLQGDCPACEGTGVNPMNTDLCIYCEIWTVNRAYGYYICTACDDTRLKPKTINDPLRYDRPLF